MKIETKTQIITPTGSPEFLSEQSMPRSSPAIRLPRGSIGCGSFGHKSRPILDGPWFAAERAIEFRNWSKGRNS